MKVLDKLIQMKRINYQVKICQRIKNKIFKFKDIKDSVNIQIFHICNNIIKHFLNRNIVKSYLINKTILKIQTMY